MLFFPYKVDINLNRIPIITLLVCIACISIYYYQYKNELIINTAALSYCNKIDDKLFDVVVEKITGGNNARHCADILLSIHLSHKPKTKIEKLASNYHVFDSLNFAQGQSLVVDLLSKHHSKFVGNAPASFTVNIMYDPRSFSIQHMFTASFAHGNWMHLMGNLFFFFAFAASIEIIVGSLAYLFIISGIALGTNLIYSLAMFSDPNALPTLGLSGVVMGMIGLFTFLLPTAKIRCFLWVIVIVRILTIPAWVLALWYIGWDVYHLYAQNNQTNINLIVHVSGAILGFLIGLVFYRKNRPTISGSKRLRRTS